MSSIDARVPERIPALRPIYSGLHTFSETLLRVVCGAILAVHGYPKIMNPFGASGMVEGLGFVPGSFWSPLLSVCEFVAGILLVIGLFTRPAAFVATIILLVTVYAHWVAFDQGFAGAEKSILWAAITFFFLIRGSNAHSVDARLGRQF